MTIHSQKDGETVDAPAWTGLEVAIVGMAGRFPGASDVETFWRNLRGGVSSLTRFTREALLEEGVSPALLDNPAYVPVSGALEGADRFDARLFDMTPRDAEILNPQHRLFLECAWAALEHAGYDPARFARRVGVFAGSGTNRYILHLLGSPALIRAVGGTRLTLANEKDHLAAGVSYRLNLRGPSLGVQTACSTSLVAVHLACQSLINGECDMALAGGVSINVPLRSGYLYSQDGINSPDGRCRAFDAEAKGAVGGNGGGVVVLRRLEDALASGDHVLAVIRGSAINNDGAQKAGYTAPGVAGQAAVISEALTVANVDPATVQYVETHGTGTPLGDAIELRALNQVFAGREGDRRCAIGSVKTNVGHLDTGAGVTGLIKTVLSLSHGEIPPSLHFETPNPELAGGPLVVNAALRPWARNGAPRRAGVSSFGIGGTNAHVVLEEAPASAPSGPSREEQLLVLSARTETALAAAAEQLAGFLEREVPPLADAAYTLQTGRREMEHRLAVVCRDAEAGARALRAAAARSGAPVTRTERPVAFLFPGLGTQHVDMGRGLYDAEPVFREAVDECCALLQPVLGRDLREVLYSASGESSGGGWDLRRLVGRQEPEPGRDDAPLDQTSLAHPAVFVTEYALTRLWASWGVKPRALIGHSLGEYVAACVAGVLRLEDALRLVALRARLVDALPAGAMLAVPLGEEVLREILPAALDVAAVNTAESCVVAGPLEEIEAFEGALAERGTVSRRLAARHAFHSRAMEAVAPELEKLLAGFALRAPEVPLVSNVTGTWISDEEARSPAYWARHLCRTVRFADGVATLRREAGWALLEVGPGQTLGAWAMQHPSGAADDRPVVLSALRHPLNRVGDLRFALEALGSLWAAGVAVDWAAFSGGERRRRVPLPSYPFERKRYWVDPPAAEAAAPKLPTPAADEAPHPKGPDLMETPAAAPEGATAPAPRPEAIVGHLDDLASRREVILGQLKAVASELTGIEAQHILTDVHFFEAGIDSLLLLQAIQAVEARTGVRLSLVEMLEETTTLDAVARHLDTLLPPDAVIEGAPALALPAAEEEAPAVAETAPEPDAPRAVAAPPAFFPPAASNVPALPALDGGAGAGEGALERVIAQQIQLMGQQLAALRGGAAPSADVPRPVSETRPAVSAPSAEITRPVEPASSASAPHTIAQSPRAKIQPETFVAYQPVNPEGPGGLTAMQREYLDGFVARYVERTKASKAHQVRYHLPLADGRVTARFRRAWKEILYPIVGDRARGSRIWDLDGNEYVDNGQAYGCSLFGHAPDFVTRAMQEQIERGYGVGPQSALAGRAAELVCELGGNERAVFCNSGTEAVMGAVRAARAYTGRTKVAYFAGSYHGWSDIVQGRPFNVGGRREVRPTAPGIPSLPLGDVLILNYDEPASLERLAEEIGQIALVMVEPVQSRRPDLQPFAFLRELRRMTRDAGALLLFDELITGFRMGAGGAQSFFDVQADLVTYGKIVAGGLPMGVVAGTREAMSVFDGGLWNYGDDSYPTGQRTLFAGAFFKHPLSMGVAVSILEEIRRQGPGMYEALDARTTRLVERINAFLEAGRYPITTAHFASCFRFFFGPEVKFPDLFNHHLVAEGVHILPETGTHFLSTAHTDDDLEKVFQAVCASVEAMRRGGFIPEAPSDGDEPRSTAGVAPIVVETAPKPEPAAEPSADAEGGIQLLPLTEGQRQLWVESQMGEAAGLAYIESCSIRLRGALDVEALRTALQALADRHDTLRATFSPEGDAQRIHPALRVELPLVDFRGVGPGDREERLEAWVRRTVRQPFDLAEGPLARFGLAAVSDDEHLLVISVHHAILDGWSFGVVVRELGLLYAAAREGRAPALPARPAHETLVRAHAKAQTGDAAAEKFWTAQFADGVPVFDLPSDRPRPPVRSYRGERVRRELGLDLMMRLAEMGRPHGFTMFNLVFSAFYLWLSRLSGHDDLVVGTPSAGQTGTPGGAELVGYSINVLPVRFRVDPALTFVEHARGVRRAVLRAVEHQNVSVPRLVKALLKTRDAGRPPLYSVMLNLDQAGGEVAMGDLSATLETNFPGGCKVDLRFVLTERPDGLVLDCEYATDLFDGATIERWLAAYERLLAGVAERPDLPVGAVDMVSDDDLHGIVDAFCDAALKG